MDYCYLLPMTHSKGKFTTLKLEPIDNLTSFVNNLLSVKTAIFKSSACLADVYSKQTFDSCFYLTNYKIGANIK